MTASREGGRSLAVRAPPSPRRGARAAREAPRLHGWGAPPRPDAARFDLGAPDSPAAARLAARIALSRSGLSGGWAARRASSSESSTATGTEYSSSRRLPTIMCWVRGTGRCSETTTAVRPRTCPSQSPNSSALDTVADRETTRTSGARWMMTSSHTGPRKRSAR